MFNKRNPMKYFSGSALARLPIYKLAAGGMAVVMTVGVGAGVFAAGYVPQNKPAPAAAATPTPTPTPTPTATPTPTPTPEPDKPLEAEVTVVQQDIGVQLFVLPVQQPEPEPTPAAGAAASKPTATATPTATPTPTPTATPTDAERQPLLDVEATVSVTDAKGEAALYSVDTTTGTVLVEDAAPGDYIVAVQPMMGYIVPDAQTVTVKEKVVYKADTKAVKEKIVQATQVNEKAEDSASKNQGSAPIQNEVKDTVAYADSAKTEKERVTVYTAKLSGTGHLLLKDGTESPYLPTYAADGKTLNGAARDANYAAPLAETAWRMPGINRMALAHRTDAEPPAAAADPATEAPEDEISSVTDSAPGSESTASSESTGESGS